MLQDEKLVSSKLLISAKHVLDNWNLDEHELVEEIRRGNMNVVFASKKPREAPDGDIVYLCIEGDSQNIYHHSNYSTGSDWYDLDDVYLYRKQVYSHEECYPHLNYAIAKTASDDNNEVQDKWMSADQEWMPAHEVRVIVGMTPISFVELLNTGYFETNREQDRRDFAEKQGWEIESVPFFKTSDLDTLRIHRLSFKENSARLCLLKKPSPILDYYLKSNANPEDEIDLNIQRISELESQKAELQAKIAELEAAQTTQKLLSQNDKPRTAPATEAAQASLVEKWKGYAAIMAKVAYDCGLQDRKQITRSGYKQLADRHGGLPPTPLELLRDALPEGVTKKTSGPSPQG